MGFVEAIQSFYQRYFDFETRSTRSEYWWFFLYKMIAYVVLLLIPVGSVMALTGGGDLTNAQIWIMIIPFSLFYLVNIIPSIAVAVRRFHDQDMSGWMYLLRIIPYVGGIILLIFMVIEGKRGANRFGPDPLGGDIEDTFA